MNIPSESECFELLAKTSLAPAVVHHCALVNRFALDFASKIKKEGVVVNTDLLSAAALLHDVMKMDAQVCHCLEGGAFLREKGFFEVASIVEKHGINNLDEPNLVPRTIEEKILMYSDLRVCLGRIVSIDERFDYICERYKPKNQKKFQKYMEFAKELEQELLVLIDDSKEE